MLLTRREFIKVTSAGGAGLALGLYCSSERNPDVFSPNAWLVIDSHGDVTITVARSEMGQGVRTSLPMIVAEELDADWSRVRIDQAPADPDKYGSQSTGGSASVRNSYGMLRKAGAAARSMLLTAAANRWGVPVNSCSTANGVVHHVSSGRSVPYGDLAEDASKLPVPADPKLKDPSEFKIIGTRVPRLDTPDKVNGRAIYGIDTSFSGMLFAAVARPPSFGSKVLRVESSRTKSVEGVRDVMQLDDGVAVVADSTWAAFTGRDALVVTWDEGPFSRQSSEAIWSSFQEAARKEGSVEFTRGDPKSAFPRSFRKVQATYRAPFVAHVSMEPMNCTADVRADRCEIWAPSQTPQEALSEVSSFLGLPTEKVSLHVTLMGGGFGRRLETDYVLEAVKISQRVGAPVKVVWSRTDDMRHDFYRPAVYSELKAGLDQDGTLQVWMHRLCGASSGGLVTHGSRPLYSIPNVLIDSHILETGVPVGPWRSVGLSQNGFFVECFIDEIAHAAGKDAFEFRKSLLREAPRLLGALELAAQKSGWKSPLPAGHGLGIAAVQGFGSFVAQVAEVSIDRAAGRLRVHRVVCAVDCGQVINPRILESQIESGIVYGLSAAMKGEITIAKGGVVQGSFDDYDVLRIDEMPRVETHIVPSHEAPGGIGEVAVPPIAPAISNALFAATGKRIRRLPIRPEDLG